MTSVHLASISFLSLNRVTYSTWAHNDDAVIGIQALHSTTETRAPEEYNYIRETLLSKTHLQRFCFPPLLPCLKHRGTRCPTQMRLDIRPIFHPRRGLSGYDMAGWYIVFASVSISFVSNVPIQTMLDLQRRKHRGYAQLLDLQGS